MCKTFIDCTFKNYYEFIVIIFFRNRVYLQKSIFEEWLLCFCLFFINLFCTFWCRLISVVWSNIEGGQSRFSNFQSTSKQMVFDLISHNFPFFWPCFIIIIVIIFLNTTFVCIISLAQNGSNKSFSSCLRLKGFNERIF